MAVGSLALVAIFVVSSGGSDVVQSAQRSPAAEQEAPQLGVEARKDLQAQATRFEERLTAAPDDLEALEVLPCRSPGLHCMSFPCSCTRQVLWGNSSRCALDCRRHFSSG